MEKIELSNSSLRAIENYIAGKNILKDSVYTKLLTELNRCLKSLDNYVTYQTAEGTMQQYCERLLKKYEGLKDAMFKTKDYYDNLTNWKREFHNVGMNKDSQEELPMQMKLVRTIKKTKKKDGTQKKIDESPAFKKSKGYLNELNRYLAPCAGLAKYVAKNAEQFKSSYEAESVLEDLQALRGDAERALNGIDNAIAVVKKELK